MKNANVHVKLENEEAIAINREALLAEKELLEAVKSLKRYEALRKEEFSLKSKLKKDLAALASLVKETESCLPKDEEAEEEIKQAKEKQKAKAHIKPAKVKEGKKTELENEIDDIRAKLAALGVSE